MGHQQNVKTSPGPPRGVMVPVVLLVHPDPPWSTFSVKFQKVWIRIDRSGPGGPRGPQPPLVDQERSGPPWTTLRHFPNAGRSQSRVIVEVVPPVALLPRIALSPWITVQYRRHRRKVMISLRSSLPRTSI